MDKEVNALLEWLEERGFEIAADRRHFVVTHRLVPEVSSPLPKTPSDWRSLMNTQAQLARYFKDVPGIDWRTMPGRSGRRNRTLVDRVRGSAILSVLAELKGTRGEPIFEGRVHVKRDGGIETLVVTNPWYVQGSEDPTRSKRTMVIRIPQGNQTLEDHEVDELADFGVDLTLASEAELQEQFTHFAGQQWKSVKPERHRIRTEWIERRMQKAAGRSPGDTSGRPPSDKGMRR